MKTGLFVGSFNPPTKAHLDITKILYNQKILDKIVFVPVNNSKKKLVSLDERIKMLNSYVKQYNYLEVSNVMRNYTNNFNYQVLNELSKCYDDIYIIMGSDLLEKLNTFTNYEEIIKKYNFIIITRFNINNLNIIKNNYKNYQDKFIIFNYQSNISSSLVREKIRKKEDISNIIDINIEKYIKEKKLYLD